MLLPFTGNAEVFQCFMDTAIDFCKLFGSKKDNVGDEAGAGSEVALGRGVTVHTAGRSVEVPRVQASALPHTFPGSKLDAVPGGVARQNHIVEIRQQPVVSRQAAGCQLGRRLHLAHVLGSGFGDRDCFVQSGAPVIIRRILPPVPHRAGIQREAETLSVQLYWQEALLRFRFYGKALVLEVQG